LCPWSAQIWKRVGHRTFTHSLAFLALSYIAGPAAFLGLLSHILLDLLTPSGVQLAWPHNTSFVVLGGPIKTGSRTENILFGILAAVSLVLIVALACHRTPFELLTEVLNWSS
jgi:inner membrane protein